MIVTAACSVFVFLCAWACVDRVMSKLSDFLTFSYDIPDLPERSLFVYGNGDFKN